MSEDFKRKLSFTERCPEILTKEGDRCSADLGHEPPHVLDLAAPVPTEPHWPVRPLHSMGVRCDQCSFDGERQLCHYLDTKPKAESPEPLRRVGCEGEDGLLRVHKEDETCDVCAPTGTLRLSRKEHFAEG